MIDESPFPHAAKSRREQMLGAGRRLVRRALLPVWPHEGETWDRDAGVTTERITELDGLTVDGTADDGHAYVPTPPRLVRSWMDLLPDDALPGYTFVDMGSGLGRVLLMASERPFGRVLGVEFAHELHDAAEENIRHFPAHRRRCTDVRSALGDAGAFAFPDDPLVIYLDNPFGETVMRRVLSNLGRSYRDLPRPMVVVYQQLRQEDSATDNLGLLDDATFLRGTTLRFALRDRPHLRSFVVRIHTTPEARRLLPQETIRRGSA